MPKKKNEIIFPNVKCVKTLANILYFNLVFIFQMVPGGTAASSGKLRIGDRILKVNGTDVTQATHQEAVMELLRQVDNIILTVRHDPLPEGFQVIV